MENYFPFGIFILILIKRLFNSPSKENNQTQIIENQIANFEITYVINGNPIDFPHHIFYLIVLDLIEVEGISDSDIIDAAKKEIDLLDSVDPNYYQKITLIYLGRSFLLDQYKYVTNLN